MEALTGATGGRHLAFTRQAGLEDDVMKVSKEIHSRYLVSFTPPQEATGSFHTLEIQIKDRPDAVVRTRPGYWDSNWQFATRRQPDRRVSIQSDRVRS